MRTLTNHPLPPERPIRKDISHAVSWGETTALRFASLLLAGLAHAQNIRVNIPFQFNAGDSLLPAGTYIVKTRFAVSPSGSSFHIAITDLHGKVWRFVNTHAVESSQAQDKDKLVFTCYSGDTCLLSQIWTGDSTGLQVVSRKVFTETAKQQSEQPVRRVVAAVQ